MGDLPAPDLWHVSGAPLGTLAHEGLRTNPDKYAGYDRYSIKRHPRWAGANRYGDREGPHSSMPRLDDIIDWEATRGRMTERERIDDRKFRRKVERKNNERWWNKVKDTGATYVFGGPQARERAASWHAPPSRRKDKDSPPSTLVGVRPMLGPEGPGQFTMTQPTVNIQRLVPEERQMYQDVSPERLMFVPHTEEEYDRAKEAEANFMEGGKRGNPNASDWHFDY